MFRVAGMKPGIQEGQICVPPSAVARGSSPSAAMGCRHCRGVRERCDTTGAGQTFGQHPPPPPRLSGEGVRMGGAPAAGASGVRWFFFSGFYCGWAANPGPLRGGLALPSAPRQLPPFPSRPVPSRGPCEAGSLPQQPLAAAGDAGSTDPGRVFLTRAVCRASLSPRPRSVSAQEAPPHRGWNDTRTRHRHSSLSVRAQNNLGTALGRQGSKFLTFILFNARAGRWQGTGTRSPAVPSSGRGGWAGASSATKGPEGQGAGIHTTMATERGRLWNTQGSKIHFSLWLDKRNFSDLQLRIPPKSFHPICWMYEVSSCHF